MPVLPRRRDEIRQTVEELKRRKFDDAIGSRLRGLPPATPPDPVGGFVPGQHVTDAGDPAVWAMWRLLQDGQTPRPLQEKATTNPVRHVMQTAQAKPKQSSPHSR
jgi:hypothetical protein